jgi:pseudaminic acid cytidylyltransferase
MAAELSALAVIPARGGSKRIPRKNIKPFHGVPLLTRTIALVRGSNVFDRIVVSTDDDEIAAVATAAGADTPFKRPTELANDTAPTLPVIEHAVREMQEGGADPAFVCCVYPAAVLMRETDLALAYRQLREEKLDYVFTAAGYAYPIQRALRERGDGRCEMMWPEHRQTRSQDLEPAFHDAGQFYFGRRDAWLQQRPIFSPESRMLVVPHYRVQDIDTEEDWARAELIFELLQREG